MVRNSKFSLPSFGRGRSNTAETDDSVNIKHLNSMTSVRSMHDPNQSKAEQLLGPSETGGGMNQSRGARCLGMIRLKKQPSAMTIGNDEMNYGGTKGYKHHNEQRPDASSPTIRPGQSVSLLSFASRSIRTAPSTSTLRSQYDNIVPSYPASQQNHAASAREAFRRGYPSIPPRRTAIVDTHRQLGHRPNMSEKPQPESNQRRPTHINLAALNLRPQSPPRQHSHHKVTSSPSLLSEASEDPSPSSPTMRNWLGWTRKLGRQANYTTEGVNGGRSEVPSYSSRPGGAAVVITKRTDNVENWIDDAELEDEFDTMGDRRLGSFRKDNRPSPTESQESAQSSSSVVTLTSQLSPQINGNSRIPIRPRQSSLPPYRQPTGPASSDYYPHRSNSTRVNKINESDLQIESVLALSSSESDSEPETQKPKKPPTKPVNKTPGVAITDFGNRSRNASQSSTYGPPATAAPDPPQHRNFAKPFRPAPNHNRAAGTSFLSQSSSVHWELDAPKDSSEAQSPPTSQPPSRSPNRSPTSPLFSSAQNGASNTPFLQVQPSHSPQASTSTTNTNPNARSRMMAVSLEEEKLLSAMRSKRASMRKADLAEGITLAIEHGLALPRDHNLALPRPHGLDPRDSLGVPRPRTAETVGSGSFFSESQGDGGTENLDGEVERFPNPPGAVLRLREAAVSSEDLRILAGELEKMGGKWESKETGIGLGGRSMGRGDGGALGTDRGYRASKASYATTTLSSDLAPSPTMSGEVPPTPPQEGYVGWAHSKGYRINGDGEGDRLRVVGHAEGHSRKRTLSSVLFLDGVEERAREREEELGLWTGRRLGSARLGTM
jgi:hypothetical protein